MIKKQLLNTTVAPSAVGSANYLHTNLQESKFYNIRINIGKIVQLQSNLPPAPLVQPFSKSEESNKAIKRVAIDIRCNKLAFSL